MTGNHRRKGTIIISGYPCIGKSCVVRDAEMQDRFGPIVDLDSSQFSWDRRNYPKNYNEAIRKTAASLFASKSGGGIILISTLKRVPPELKRDGYYVAQVYPDKNPRTKVAWLSRLERREKDGKDSALYKMVDESWIEWYDELEGRNVSKSNRLSWNQGLHTVIKEIVDDFETSQISNKTQKLPL